MPSKYFSNHYQNAVESKLVENLYNEAIYIQGFSAHYLPNVDDTARDLIYGDDPLKKFNVAYKLDTYLVNDGVTYGDEQDFFSKFGLEVRNSIKIQFTVREFKKQTSNKFTKPREGDLIFIPFMKDNGELFEIKFVNTSKDQYTLARTAPYFYELSLEPFKYNNENIDTGIAAIDDIEIHNSYSIELFLQSGTGTFTTGETIYQGTSNSYIAKAEVVSWDSANNILNVINISGKFSNTASQNVIGSISNANYTLHLTDDRPLLDNDPLADEALSVVETSELNPFGSLTYY